MKSILLHLSLATIFGLVISEGSPSGQEFGSGTRILQQNETGVLVTLVDNETSTPPSTVEVNVYAVYLLSNANVLANTLASIANRTNEITKPLFDYLPCLEPLSPGDGPPSANRLLRGQMKHRQLPSTCPASCSSSGSLTCRALKCAYCGKTCLRERGRTLALSLSGQDRKTIESQIDALLEPYCLGNRNCLLKSRVKQV
jgi:hypothetical protein